LQDYRIVCQYHKSTIQPDCKQDITTELISEYVNDAPSLEAKAHNSHSTSRQQNSPCIRLQSYILDPRLRLDKHRTICSRFQGPFSFFNLDIDHHSFTDLLKGVIHFQNIPLTHHTLERERCKAKGTVDYIHSYHNV